MEQIARHMAKKDIGSVAITQDGVLLGIVTERDLVRAVADRRNPQRTSAGELMTPNPDSLDPDVSTEYAATWMLAAGYRHLPVMDGDQLLGIVSMKDLMWALTERGSADKD